MNITTFRKRDILILVIILAGFLSFLISSKVNQCYLSIAQTGSGPNCTRQYLEGKQYEGLLEFKEGVKHYSNNYYGISFSFNDPNNEIEIDHEHSNSIWFANDDWYLNGKDAYYLMVIKYSPSSHYETWRNDYGSVEDYLIDYKGFIGGNIPHETEVKYTHFENDQGVKIINFYHFEDSNRIDNFGIINPNNKDEYISFEGTEELVGQVIDSLKFNKNLFRLLGL